MERSEQTLSTRDLAHPNEPAADRGVEAEPVAGDGEGAGVYDQEREGQTHPDAEVAGREQIGTGAGAQDRTGEVAPAVETSAPTAVGDGRGEIGTTAPRDEPGATRASGVGATPGSTALADESIPPPEAGTAPAGTSAPDAPAIGRTDAPGAGARAGAGAGAGTGTGSAGAGTGTGSAADAGPLLSAEASSSFQRRWEEVQTRFVDEPRGAVQEADGLVANLMKQLAEGFAHERERLEAQWDRGEDISTEDLRIALQRYRSFFQRLLSA